MHRAGTGAGRWLGGFVPRHYTRRKFLRDRPGSVPTIAAGGVRPGQAPGLRGTRRGDHRRSAITPAPARTGRDVPVLRRSRSDACGGSALPVAAGTRRRGHPAGAAGRLERALGHRAGSRPRHRHLFAAGAPAAGAAGQHPGRRVDAVPLLRSTRLPQRRPDLPIRPTRKAFFGPIHGCYTEDRSSDSALYFARDGLEAPNQLSLAAAA